MGKKIKLKPSKTLQMALFPLLFIFSVGFVLFLRPFSDAETPDKEKD
jgi:hypothetical protein